MPGQSTPSRFGIARPGSRRGRSLTDATFGHGGQHPAYRNDIGPLGAGSDLSSLDPDDGGSVASLFEVAVDRFGQVDFLVTCADILRFNPVEDISEAEWDQVVDTHMKGTITGEVLTVRGGL